MKLLFKNIQTLLIVILILVVLFLRNCSNTPNPILNLNPPVVVRVETKWDTIREEVPIYIPKWNDRIEYRPSDTVYIDTNKVLDDYFASYYYEDIISNDSITITIKDTISQNKIRNRSLKYDMLYPTITITRDSIVKGRGFYFGVGMGGSTTQLNYIGGEFLFKSKKRTAFGLGLGINRNFRLSLMGKLYWKLGK